MIFRTPLTTSLVHGLQSSIGNLADQDIEVADSDGVHSGGTLARCSI